MRRLLLAIGIAITMPGCYSGQPRQHPFLDPPPEGATFPESKYTILVVYGPYESPSMGFAYERYHSDTVQVRDGWVLFHDKTLDKHVRTPAALTTVIGGDEPILPYIRQE